MKIRTTKKQAQAASAAALSARIEIARSFSFKLNVGNYESRDFFCSQKAECRPDEAEQVSERVYQFCKAQVLKAVREYQEEAAAQFQAQRPAAHPVAVANTRAFEERQKRVAGETVGGRQ